MTRGELERVKTAEDVRWALAQAAEAARVLAEDPFLREVLRRDVVRAANALLAVLGALRRSREKAVR